MLVLSTIVSLLHYDAGTYVKDEIIVKKINKQKEVTSNVNLSLPCPKWVMFNPNPSAMKQPG